MKVAIATTGNIAKVSEYITLNCEGYDAHVKSEQDQVLSIWYKHHLMQHIDSINGKESCIDELAEQVVQLFQNQKTSKGDIKLYSVKVMLPKEADSDKISQYIVEKYIEYKAHPKNQGLYPIVAIGYRQ